MSVYDGKPLLASPGEFGESCETTCCRILHQQQGEVIKFHVEAQARLWQKEYQAWRRRAKPIGVLVDLKQIRVRHKGLTVELWYTPKLDRPWRQQED